MTHHRISIGITSYKDLSDTDVAKEVYAILAETTEGFAPNRMQAGLDRILISTQREFVENWVLKGSSELRESRNKNAKILERRETLWPAEWFHVGKYKGRGNLQLRHRNDLEAPDGISMDLKYSKRIDWSKLFEKFVRLTSPSFAMLHIFDTRGDGFEPIVQDYTRLDRGIVGEWWFVGWQSSLGEWRKPDKWRLDERRQYKYLPELPWLSHFGPEFDGRFDSEMLAAQAHSVQRVGDGLMVQLTPTLDALVGDPIILLDARRRARACFASDFFRT